jgi:hypothetical protein
MKIFSSVPQDKQMHFLVGFMIAGFTDIFVYFAWGILIAFLFGLGKELNDKRKGGLFDPIDWLVTTIGGVSYFVFRIFELIIKNNG